MKKLAAILVVSLVTVAAAETVNIELYNFYYEVVSPVPGQGTNQCTINVNDTVVWTWFTNFHSVTADDGSFDSGLHNSGFVYSRTFNTPGFYPYYCFFHGAPGVGMFGTITVVSADERGDLNCDRAVDTADIHPFAIALTDTALYEDLFPRCPITNADMNEDGQLNGADVPGFVSALLGP